MEKCHKIAALYVATLKAMTLILQHCHWTSRGDAFYGDHLLFERLYNKAQENLDLAAEKFVGLFSSKVLSYDLQTDLLKGVLDKYSDLEGSPAQMALATQKDFLKFSQQAYDTFEKEQQLTLGLDDSIMTIASDREEAAYLLQQLLEG
jgi:DNA-binding ferritin-like protein